MSADSVQQTLGGGVPDHVQQAEHRTMDGPDTSNLVANPDRSECWCADCDARLTIGSKEWGHAKDCEHYCWRSDA